MDAKFWKALGYRALRTFAQAVVAEIGTGAAIGFGDVGWVRVVSVAGVAALCSALMSIATGLPEVDDGK